LTSKKEVMAIHKRLQAISIAHMKDLKKKPVTELQKHFDIIIHVLADKLYIELGVENEMLDKATDDLNLEEDPEYKAMEVEYTQQVAAIRLGEPE